MSLHRSRLLAAMVAGMLVNAPGAPRMVIDADDEPTPREPDPPAEPDPEEVVKLDFSSTRPGARQAARIAKGKYDFSASERCIERIKSRNGKN